MTPVIQPIDYASVLEIRQRVMYPDRSIDEMRLPADPEGEHLAVWVGERPVTIVSVFRMGSDWQFRKLAMEPDVQGRGYASLLLRHVLEQARRQGATRLWCNARLSATALYRRMGMQEEGKVWEKNGIEFVVMALSINQQ